MRNFKSFLTEGVEFAPWHIKDFDKLNHIAKNVMTPNMNMVANQNGTVSFKGDAYLSGTDMYQDSEGEKLPYKIQTAYKSFTVRSDDLVSLWGLPDKVNKDLIISSKRLKDLDHCTPQIGKTLELHTPALDEFNCKVNCEWLWIIDCAMTGLKNIHKYFNCRNVILGQRVAPTIKSNVLGMLLIDKLIGFSQNGSTNSDIEQVCKIINRHIFDGRDIIGCKEELMAQGYKEYAKL